MGGYPPEALVSFQLSFLLSYRSILDFPWNMNVNAGFLWLRGGWHYSSSTVLDKPFTWFDLKSLGFLQAQQAASGPRHCPSRPRVETLVLLAAWTLVVASGDSKSQWPSAPLNNSGWKITQTSWYEWLPLINHDELVVLSMMKLLNNSGWNTT